MFGISNFIFVLTATLHITWSVPFLLFYIFDYRLYHIKKKKDIVLIIKRLKTNISTITDDDSNPCGIVFGKWFVAYVIEYYTNTHDGCCKEIYIFCKKQQYLSLTKDNNIHYNQLNSTKAGITIWERSGTFYQLSYSNRPLHIEKYEPFPNQKEILTKLKKEYATNNYCITFINGIPGIGKSFIPILLANELNCTYCNDWNPTDPSDDLSILYNSILPSKEEPLVLVLEEIDIILTNIHKGILSHKNIPIPVHNKITWNNLLDKINLGLYPYLILFLISNKSISDISSLDKSYIRDGRITSRYELKVST